MRIDRAALDEFVRLYHPGWFDGTDTAEVLKDVFLPRRIITVYVAGPYTGNGEPGSFEAHKSTEKNVRETIRVASELSDLGFYPFVPHLAHYWNAQTEYPYERWMQWCFIWLARSDAVLRLPGESKGADDEVALAELFNIPVFYSIEELKEREEL